jgi:hypothetical protein
VMQLACHGTVTAKAFQMKESSVGRSKRWVTQTILGSPS